MFCVVWLRTHEYYFRNNWQSLWNLDEASVKKSRASSRLAIQMLLFIVGQRQPDLSSLSTPMREIVT